MFSATVFLLVILAPLGLAITGYVLWPLLRGGTSRDDPTADAAGSSGTPGPPAAGTAGVSPAAGTSGASSPAGEGGVAGALNREIVRERRAQLDRDLAQLPPDSPERERLILEFSAAALVDLAPPTRGRPRPALRQRRWIAAALMAALLVAGPLAFYRVTGLPDVASPEFARQAAAPTVEGLVAELERRLATEPGAVDGWLMLGRTRMALGELPAALTALEKALSLDSPDAALAAQIRVDLADALAQSSASRLAGRPWTLIQEALSRDPANQKALALAGAYQVTQGNRTGALKYWEPLLAQLPPGSDQHAQISAFIGDVKSGRRPGGNGAAEATGPAGAGPVLSGRVELAPALAAAAEPQDVVFVAVRGVDANGQPAGPPAAAVRIRVADLPFDFSLSDRDAMSPAARLSGQLRVVVVARVSRSGAAASASGDLEGRSEVVAPDASGVAVRIDRVLP